ncbi:F-box/WD repeat-containing protein 4 [Pseudolycoriella hygida]|uniref:F-box/WD repeat-containing protein 4 n=1 Tax=Pseudolycoriella hygida TaxID=35572 RepID=A0A9Q0RUR1_9DIPT|nr:F-box/WD repeat-containing protein 4 [Pseudolycoriella hygida]
MNLTDLNEHLLLIIFDLCSVDDLQNLHLTCRKFHDLIVRFDRLLFRKHSYDLLLTGHRNNGKIQKNTLHDLTYLKRVKLSYNWRHGKYDEKVLFKHRMVYQPQLLLEKDLLYLTHGGELRIHRRLKSKNMLSERALTSIGTTRAGDITSFVKHGNVIFGGRDTGYAFIYEDDECYEEKISDHVGQRRAYINAVDFHSQTFVTTSMTSFKVWRKIYELDMVSLELMTETDSAFKCLKLSPSGDECIAGIYSDRRKEALRLYDMETNTERILNSQTGSVYSVLWKDSKTVLSANYDSTLRMFDIRSNDEQIWMDPFDSSIFSLDYDGLYGALCGMRYHCRVTLFDLRMPKKYVQVYFPSLHNFRGSPAYSIACDLSQLFIATDHSLRILNFNADWAREKSYCNWFNFGDTPIWVSNTNMRTLNIAGIFLILFCSTVWCQKTPMFYGWFFDEVTANGLKEVTESYLTSLYGNVQEVQVFLKNVSSIANIEQPLKYYTKPVDPNTGNYDRFFHITAFYCGTEDCSEYSRKIAPYLQQIFTSHLVGVFFTPRTYGIRVNLTSLQREIFNMNNSNVVDSKTFNLLDEPCDADVINGIQFCPQNDTNLHPTNTRAHITLGCAPNVSAVTTGLDLIEILEMETNQKFCARIQTDQGNLIQMGENCDNFVYYLKKQMVTNSTFQVYYNNGALIEVSLPCRAQYVTVFLLVFFLSKVFS